MMCEMINQCKNKNNLKNINFSIIFFHSMMVENKVVESFETLLVFLVEHYE